MATINLLKFQTVNWRKSINDAVTEDSVLVNCTLAEEIMQFIVLKETTGNAVDINIGTTVSGKEIADTLSIDASGYVVVEVTGITRLARSVYIDSLSWGGASLQVQIVNIKLS